MKFYGSKICPSCVETKKTLDKIELEYEYFDITENTNYLREFLKLRDTRHEFEQIKKEGRIGIPCFLTEDDYIVFNVNEL